MSDADGSPPDDGEGASELDRELEPHLAVGARVVADRPSDGIGAPIELLEEERKICRDNGMDFDEFRRAKAARLGIKVEEK